MAARHEPNLRIGIISAEYPPETGYGGIGTYSRYLAEYLAQSGHDVSVFARSADQIESVTMVSGVRVYRIAPLPYPLPRSRWMYPLRWWCTRCFPHTLIRLSWSLAVAGTIKKALSKQPRFDLIEAPECGAEGLFISPRMARCRVIRMHTPWEIIREFDHLKEPWGDSFALPFLEKRAAINADGCSAPSHAVAGEIMQRWPIPSVTVIRNPLPVRKYRLSSGTNWIYTGRIERRKGVHHLLRAYLSCQRRSGKTLPELTLMGRSYGTDRDGTDYGLHIRSIIDTSNNDSSIRWIEGGTIEEVATLLQSCAVAFFPSLWENFPYACLEAMASGCVVVAARCGGFPEIINHEENGILVEPDSVRSLVSAMSYVLEHPECTTTLGGAARRYVERTVAPDIAGREIEQFYRHLLER